MPGSQDENQKAISVLRRTMKLSPYESRAYLELIGRPEVTPGRLAELTGIPRPRTYDVLRSLMAKGLAVERKGKPVRYRGVDPRHGLPALYDRRRRDTERDLADALLSVRRLAGDLGEHFERAQGELDAQEGVVLTGISEAFWEQFRAMKEKTRHEYIGASASAQFPPYEIFLAEEKMLQRGVRLRLIRPFPSISKSYAEWYLRLIRRGFEVRSSVRVDFSFDVSDGKDALLWLNDRSDRPPSDLLWLRRTPLAPLLAAHFETLWAEAKPVEDRLKQMLS
ncbi:MAG TPA: helix-turn-helix domain-containing protein [Nitrososphaerales archaeon]